MARQSDSDSLEKARAFWNTDLSDIEAAFLGDRKITQLKVSLSDVVPHQGSVLLTRSVDIDDVC